MSTKEIPIPMLLFEHTIVALIVQVMVGLTTRNWWAGAALASGYFLGREIAQAEYRWIEAFGEGLRANLPWWGAADLRVWAKADQFGDWIGPVVVNVTVAIGAQVRAKRRMLASLQGPPSSISERRSSNSIDDSI